MTRKARFFFQCQLALSILFLSFHDDLLLVVVSAQDNQEALSLRKRDLAGNCESRCQNPAWKDLQYFDGDDLLRADTMLARLQQQRVQYVQKLREKDYGEETYTAMFEPVQTFQDPITNETSEQRVNVGRNRIFKDPVMLPVNKNMKQEELPNEGPSTAWNRMVRKYQMKLLQVQLGIVEERMNAKNICFEGCTAGEEGSGRRSRQLEDAKKASGGLYTKFTWVNGGHSASAGHGDFYRESYTAELGRALKPILGNIGLDFVTKNYAMGGTDSAEEVALCSQSIFGRDVDSISWDYGMTDGHDKWKMIMYFYRAAYLAKIKDSLSQPGNIPHRPSMIGIHQGDDFNFVLQTMQDMGATVLGLDQRFQQNVVLKGAPDMFGLSDAQIAQVPPYVQYLKCNGQIETGDPGCKDHKFNLTMCERRKAMTSWHPGWKYHALVGNELAMTVLEVVETALQNMIAAQPEGSETTEQLQARLQSQLQTLNQEEEADYGKLLDSPLPEDFGPHLEKWWGEDDARGHLKDMDIKSFYKDPVFCHTAILPAEIRFQGLLTENFTHTTNDIYDQTYEMAVMLPTIQDVENPSKRSNAEPKQYRDPRPEKADLLVLAGAPGEYQVCDDYLNLDKKDFFYISSAQDGWRSLTLPNDSEKKFYTEFDTNNQKGWILACLSRCDWGNCAEGDLQPYFGYRRPKARKNNPAPTEAEIKAMGTIEMEINGQKVTEASNMHFCYALKNSKGHVWQPNSNGQYEIRAKITNAEKYAYLRFSSFVFL